MMHWPGKTVAVPPVERPDVELHGEGLMLVGDPDRTPTIELPEEWYLRELPDLDASDPDAILEFTATWGLFGDPRDMRRGNVPGEPDLFMPAIPVLRLDKIRELRDRLIKMTEIWLHHYPTNSADVTDQLFLSANLNSGLRAFQVHIDLVFGDVDGDIEKPRPNCWPLNTYEAACLQLANHIAEKATLKPCANENCGRLFFRQRGRAQHDQYRIKGVKHCSKLCAQAVASRNSRKRRKSAAA